METMLSDSTMESDEFLEELLKFLSSTNDPDLIRLYALKFKEQGNVFYAQKDFVNAIICYAKATDIFSLVSSLEVEDERLFRDLAVQLHLNLAICSLKLHDYEDAVKYCSWVLIVDPHNVKAFFRRALALVKLDRPIEAHSDLIMAQKFEPGNKEIKRELESIEKSIKSSQCGPKGLAGATPLDDSRKSKRRNGVETLEENWDDIVRSTSKPRVQTSSSLENGVRSNVIEGSSAKSPNTNPLTSPSTSLNVVETMNLVEPKFRFVNRLRRGSSLQISESAYQRLANGEEIEFYNCGKGSFMSIRTVASTKKDNVVSLEVGVELETMDCTSFGQPNISVLCEVGEITSAQREDESVLCGPDESSSSVVIDSTSSSSSFDVNRTQDDLLWFVSNHKRFKRLIRASSTPPSSHRHNKASSQRHGSRTRKRKPLNFTNNNLTCRKASGKKRKSPPSIFDGSPPLPKKSICNSPVPFVNVVNLVAGSSYDSHDGYKDELP